MPNNQGQKLYLVKGNNNLYHPRLLTNTEAEKKTNIFILNDNKLTWLDKTQIEPSEAEIKTGLIAYEAALQTEAEAKADAKAALLIRLGITAEEATLLLS